MANTVTTAGRVDGDQSVEMDTSMDRKMIESGDEDLLGSGPDE